MHFESAWPDVVFALGFAGVDENLRHEQTVVVGKFGAAAVAAAAAAVVVAAVVDEVDVVAAVAAVAAVVEVLRIVLPVMGCKFQPYLYRHWPMFVVHRLQFLAGNLSGIEVHLGKLGHIGH